MVINARVPQLWRFFLVHYLQTSERLARQLWKNYRPLSPQTAAWHFARADKTPTFEHLAAVARDVLTPALLLEALERLAPPGPKRPREVRDLEETILRATNQHGMWR